MLAAPAWASYDAGRYAYTAGDFALAHSEWNPLAENMELTGPITAKLFAASSARDTDFTVTITDIMKTMTARRFRHMPVIEDGVLKGMVSISDVVKHRLDETEMEGQALRDYVLAAH